MTTAPEAVGIADDTVRGSHCGCIDLFGDWISVNKSLPEHLQKVLFCYSDGENESSWYRYPATMRIGDFYRESPTEATFRHDCRPVNNKNVAWWMPIPNPSREVVPRGEKGGLK